ncbi:M13 family metallopeptidase [Mucilaginibacter sp. HD30]
MKVKYTHFFAAGIVCLVASAFVIERQQSDPPVKYIDPVNMDMSVKPGDDFYLYANGGWTKNNVIPAKQSAWGGFNVLIQENTDKLIAMVDAVSKMPAQAKGGLKQRVGDLYASGMDSLAIEKRGYEPIKPLLARVSKITDINGVLNEVATARVNGEGGTLFSFGAARDSKNPAHYMIDADQGGTTLADRDYYLKDDARTKTIREAYKKYIVSLFTLTGTPAVAAAKNADIILSMETTLAKAQMSRVDRRDPNLTYHKYKVSDFSKKTPHLNWVKLSTMMKATPQDSMLVDDPDFFKTADEMVATIPVSQWKVYLTWNILKNNTATLSAPFVDARFAFNKVLSGQTIQAPRNERMATLVDGSIGELLGQLYVEKYFTQAAKQRMLSLVNNLKVALGERLQGLEWMSPDTKTKALKKLQAFTVKIGYPDKWENYDGLIINRGDYAGNVKRIAAWRYNYNITRLGKKVDKGRWSMTPPTVNAYYNSQNNEIVFPAGILQFPFFAEGADDAFNYGAIGAVIGHEMTHGFDDKGRLFDGDGTLRDWWTKDDNDKFTKRADQVVGQYNALTVLDTLHVNGKLTLGENIADLGGVNVAYQAFKKTKQGQSAEKIDGFTPDQRFFLAYAQVWRSIMRPEATAQRITTDTHSPASHRVNAPITNIDAWYTAFDVKPGDKMYKAPADRIRVW